MNISQIQYFIAVADHLSFTKAADKLFISQPSLSRQILLMEKELGMALFTRAGREIHLTIEGEILYEGLKKLYGDYEDLTARARQAQAGYSGTLEVGVLVGMLVGDFMPYILHFFKKHYPYIEINLRCATFDDLLEGLYNHKLDLIFSVQFNVIGREQLHFETVKKSHDHILYNKSHPLAGRDDLTLGDFRDDTFVMISPKDNARSSQLVFEACQQEGFVPQVVYAPTLQDMMLWIEAGVGVGILDTCNQLLNSENVLAIPLVSHWSPSMVVARYRQNQNPAIPIFLKALKESLRQNQPEDPADDMENEA